MDNGNTVGLFMARTYFDTVPESDHFESVLFPFLRDRLRRSGLDLRVTNLGYRADPRGRDPHQTEQEERAEDLRVLSMCGAEIERSSPLFVAVLGDRYGWLPPPDLVNVARGSRGMLAGESCSVTEFEIEVAGHLARNDRSRQLILIRNMSYDGMPADMINLYRPPDKERRRRLEVLKQRLRAEHPHRVIDYPARWDPHRGIRGIEDVSERAGDLLWSSIVSSHPAFR